MYIYLYIVWDYVCERESERESVCVCLGGESEPLPPAFGPGWTDYRAFRV